MIRDNSGSKSFSEEEKKYILEQQRKYDDQECYFDVEEPTTLTGEIFLKLLDINNSNIE